MQSVAFHHPEVDRYCVIVDRDLSLARQCPQDFEVLPLQELNLPDGDEFLFQYTILELNTAVKPWALHTLMQRGYEKVVYIDPDISLYAPMHEVMQALSGSVELVLTPHLLAPMTDKAQDQFVPTELDIRRAGTYNLGFCAFKNTPAMQELLVWWQSKLHRHCVNETDKGIFVDQSWMDLVPGMFANVFVLRHPGYNLAYWNMAQRPLAKTDELGQGSSTTSFTVLGQPLVFAHFSGLDPQQPQKVSKHQNRFNFGNINPALKNLIDDYCQRVVANNIAHYKEQPYGFAKFDDGTPIADSSRSYFRTSNRLRGLALGKPFAAKSLLEKSISEPFYQNDPRLVHIYAYFLGRLPDESAIFQFETNKHKFGWAQVTAMRVARSPEARLRKAWFARCIAWFTGLQHSMRTDTWQLVAKDNVPQLSAAFQRRMQFAPSKPTPFMGLYAPEASSSADGLWVGPELHLPMCSAAQGRVQIKGSVDLDLLLHCHSLGRGVLQESFKICVKGGQNFEHTTLIENSGPFNIEFLAPQHIFEGDHWRIDASAFVVPQHVGLNDDTRQLSWRVSVIAIDHTVLLDCSRNPATTPLQNLITPAGINLVGYLAAELGVGEAARSFARACTAVGVPYSAVDVGYQTNHLQRDTSVLSQAVNQRFAIDLMYVNADQTAATAQYLQQQGKQSRYRIGYWHWEQPQLPDSALRAFEHVDEVWVPSTFVQDAVAAVSPVPVVKIPHAISFVPTPGVQRQSFGLPDNQFLVLVMYDFNSYQYRKNPQAAIQAFSQVAANRNDAVLVVKTISGPSHAQALQALKSSVAHMRNVLFIDTFLTRQQTWDLQSCCDALISLHRAEGFGLVPAEMMFLGKPVIATGWSANVDFMTPDNSFLVKYELKPLAETLGVYPSGPLWAEADVDHAAWCLERLLDDASLAARLGQTAKTDIQCQLNPETVGGLIRNRLTLLGFWNLQLKL